MHLHTIVQLAGKSTSRHPHIICLYSIDESGVEPQPEQMAECALLAHHRKLTSYDQLVRSVLGLGCGFCTKSMYEMLARKTCCLKASSVEGSIVAVCFHRQCVAHSLGVSTSLSFFPIEYAEAFKELCNSGTKGPEDICNARSNMNRRGVQDVKEYLYSQCQYGFDLSNVSDHPMNMTTSQNAST